MIVKPLIRSNICLNAHPVGCGKEVERQVSMSKIKLKKEVFQNQHLKTFSFLVVLQAMA